LNPRRASPTPIELRVYGGANADFNLYEDEGDNYNYEKGAYSTIPIHWDEQTKTLTIGKREGTFKGLLERRIFNVVIAREGQGTGVEVSSYPDATITYDGKRASAHTKSASGAK
jgi:alpha-D-xyloside xylohydrolase